MPINKVGTKGIADGSIATADLNDGLVTSAKLQNGAVTNVKLTNTAFTLSGTSISLGGSATFNNKFVDWQSVIVADGSTGTTGVSGRGYFINTTSAAHTFTLPSSATRGDNISIKDYAGTFATNNLTIARNGHNIQGVANNSLISTNRASVVLVYVDVTRGWEFVEESNVADLQAATFISATGGTVTTDGDFKIHSFTGDGCFVVSSIGNPAGGPNSVDYLVVAGGGSGGTYYGGGGGAGGHRTSFPSPAGTTPVTAQTYPITVGAGGAAIGACAPSGSAGNNGSNSVFSTITSTGGGGGGGGGASGPGAGVNGGSGGGGGAYVSGPPGYGAISTAGSGNTPPVSPPQGNNGGTGLEAPNGISAGGGGGAGSVGSNAAGPIFPYGASEAGDGGNGIANSITGSSVTRAGGGGGATEQLCGPFIGSGGSGGGGVGKYGPAPGGSPVAGAGNANTGSGGGGGFCSTYPSGAGGKGIVVIRYKFQ